MAKIRTAKAILEQIDKLKDEYEEIVAKEKESVIERVTDAIKTYGITLDELKKALIKIDGWHPPTAVAPPLPTVIHKMADEPSEPEPSKHTGPWVKHPKGKRPIRYRDNKGNEWSGWSRVPSWIREHEANGGSREDFRVKDH
jgi:DNA-binding protein H-NS